MTVNQEKNLNSTSTAERYVGQLPGFHTAKELPDADRSLSLEGLTEPVFPPAAWLEADGGGAPHLADHPLLRGLLLELPPKGSAPSPEWLNRWFEAARSILELIYVQQR
ncbi:hypothetical protein F4553_004438 [Allocatelliglobosispora scoriae]|uniref:Uncharacterized protein n=1 Tax=Allocatelliglobosispora scoriae TaxID=643052 RepID=A0A841BV69_9ACTN|nr:hypothetical protein [Allocatelliglobosispora scoriae]MBB5871059.1 hypothetical protein [Allocatelliglobosispora scoriae]